MDTSLRELSFELIFSGRDGWNWIEEKSIGRADFKDKRDLRQRKQSYFLFSCCETAPQFKAPPEHRVIEA
jgi:hypothetical protein